MGSVFLAQTVDHIFFLKSRTIKLMSTVKTRADRIMVGVQPFNDVPIVIWRKIQRHAEPIQSGGLGNMRPRPQFPLNKIKSEQPRVGETGFRLHPILEMIVCTRCFSPIGKEQVMANLTGFVQASDLGKFFVQKGLFKRRVRAGRDGRLGMLGLNDKFSGSWRFRGETIGRSFKIGVPPGILTSCEASDADTENLSADSDHQLLKFRLAQVVERKSCHHARSYWVAEADTGSPRIIASMSRFAFSRSVRACSRSLVALQRIASKRFTISVCRVGFGSGMGMR